MTLSFLFSFSWLRRIKRSASGPMAEMSGAGAGAHQPSHGRCRKRTMVAALSWGPHVTSLAKCPICEEWPSLYSFGPAVPTNIRTSILNSCITHSRKNKGNLVCYTKLGIHVKDWQNSGFYFSTCHVKPAVWIQSHLGNRELSWSFCSLWSCLPHAPARVQIVAPCFRSKCLGKDISALISSVMNQKVMEGWEAHYQFLHKSPRTHLQSP